MKITCCLCLSLAEHCSSERGKTFGRLRFRARSVVRAHIPEGASGRETASVGAFLVFRYSLHHHSVAVVVYFQPVGGADLTVCGFPLHSRDRPARNSGGLPASTSAQSSHRRSHGYIDSPRRG